MTVKELKEKIKGLSDDIEIHLYADGEEPAKEAYICNAYGFSEKIFLITR